MLALFELNKRAAHLDVGVLWSVGHLALGVSEMLALVHGEGSSAATEAVALWSEFAAVALLAEEVAAVLGGVRRVEPLVAEAALEALLVPLGTSGQHLLSSVH